MAYELPGVVAALRVDVGHVLDRRWRRGVLWRACVRGLEGGRGTRASSGQRTRERGLRRQGRLAGEAARVRHGARSGSMHPVVVALEAGAARAGSTRPPLPAIVLDPMDGWCTVQ
jgi:hypothetical protein